MNYVTFTHDILNACIANAYMLSKEGKPRPLLRCIRQAKKYADLQNEVASIFTTRQLQAAGADKAEGEGGLTPFGVCSRCKA